MKKKFIEQVTIWAVIYWFLAETVRVVFGFFVGRFLLHFWNKLFSKKTPLDTQEDEK